MQDIADGTLNMLMSLYRELLPSLGGYLTSKTHIHRARTELFLQEAARREPLYFEQRAADEQESAYAGKGYRDHYYEVSAECDYSIFYSAIFSFPQLFPHDKTLF